MVDVLAILTALQDQIDGLSDTISAQQRTVQRLLDRPTSRNSETAGPCHGSENGATAHGGDHGPVTGRR